MTRAPTKRCIGCRRDRLTVHFYKCCTGVCGLQSRCIDCALAAARERRHRNLVIPDIPKWKVCRGCNTNKRAGQFYTKGTAADGLQFWCKDCARVAARDSKRRAARRAKTAADGARA